MYTYLVCKKKSFQRAYIFFKTKPKTAFFKMRTGAVLHCETQLGDRWCNSIQELHRNLELRARSWVLTDPNATSKSSRILLL